MGESHLNRTSVKNTRTKKIIISLLFIFIITLSALGTYYFISYKNNSIYINSLCNEKQKIDRANLQAAEVFKSFEQIDVKNTEEITKASGILSNCESLSQEALVGMKSVSPVSKYRKQYDDYIKGMETNKKIFTQTLLILGNPTHKNVEKALESLQKYISDTAQFYEQSKLGKSYISLPSELLTASDKISEYVNIQKTDYETKSRILEQYSKYFTKMEKVISSFKDVKTDLSSSIDQIKSNRTTLENVYLNIEKKLIALKEVKASLDKISIPPKLIKNHEELNNIIKGYVDYCEEFKLSLIQFEEAGSDEERLLGTNQIFEELKKQYKKLNSSFSNYINRYNQDKSSYGDISNI